jgi:hypothetical protein
VLLLLLLLLLGGGSFKLVFWTVESETRLNQGKSTLELRTLSVG